MGQETGSPSEQMMQLISGFWVSRALYAAARLGFADHLHDRPRTAAEVAERSGAHPQAVYRVLRPLASVGVFAADEQGRFSTTALGATLRSEEFRTLLAAAGFTLTRTIPNRSPL